MKSLVTDMADFNVRWGAPPPDPSPGGFRPPGLPDVHGVNRIPSSHRNPKGSVDFGKSVFLCQIVVNMVSDTDSTDAR